MMRVLLIIIVCFLASCSETKKKEFNTIQIGSLIWAKDNLDVVVFGNGDSIPESRTNEEWEKAGFAGKPTWCYYNNDPNNNLKFGKLYNWYAVNDKRGLAPIGWHIAHRDEWGDLLHETDGKAFPMNPGGGRGVMGFDLGGDAGLWWAAPRPELESIQEQEGMIWLMNMGKGQFLGGTYFDKTYGVSVICIKNQ